MNWADRHRPTLEKMRAYASDFAGLKPAPFERFQGGAHPVIPLAPESDRGTALLLIYCALRQNIHEDRLIRLLEFLWKEYDLDIFRLNHVPFSELQAGIEGQAYLRSWSLRPKVPGILRSVCDFFFRHGRLLPWVHEVGEGEECVRILAEEIFLMGKTSEFRSKPRYFLWLLTRLPGVDGRGFWSDSTMLCPTQGHTRFLREFGPLKGRRAPWTTPHEKLAYYNRFYRVLFPAQPYLVAAGLDVYLTPDPDPEIKWACRRILGGCARCAMVELCPGSDL